MADDSSCEDDIPISQLKKTDDSSFEDDDIPISQLKKKKSESTIMSVLSAMKNDPELNTKIPPEKLELISGFASKHFAAENEINNASIMAKDYSKDALLLMSKQYPTKFLDLDFKDCEYINDLTLHPLIPNMGTNDIPHDWGTQCWEIRQWRKLSQEAQDQFLLTRGRSIDELANQLRSLSDESVSNIQKEEIEEELVRIARDANMKAKDIPEQILDYFQKSKPEVFDELTWADVNEQTLCRYFELHDGCGDKHPPDNFLRDFGDSTNDILSWRCFDSSLQENYIINGKLNLEDLPSPEEAISQIHAIAVARKNSSNSDSFICANCGKEGSDVTNTCNKCKSVKYCNAACKKKHRHKHKKACESYVAAAAAAQVEKQNNITTIDKQQAQEGWDLTKIFTIRELLKSKPTMCKRWGSCGLVACCRWESPMSQAPWNTCLDCQLNDFLGFPEDSRDLPIDYMTEEHREIIATKCSHPDKKKKFPNLPTNLFNSKKTAASGGGKKSAASKPPKLSKSAMESYRKWQAEAEMQGGPNAKIVVSKPQAKKIILEKLHDEGTPMNINEIFLKLKAVVPSVVLKSCLDDMVDKSGSSSDEYAGSLCLKDVGDVRNNLYYIDHVLASAPKISKNAILSHRKWQAEAVKQGGPNAKIVVSKPEAKKIIYQKLQDGPMNINKIYWKLKAVVPSVILKSCLDDMVDKSGSSSDVYSGSLCIKEGGNAMNNIYYIDRSKQLETSDSDSGSEETIGWECNFCQAVFDTVEEANEHEKVCLDRKLPPKKENRVISLFKSMRINDGELTSPSDEDLFEQPPPSEDCQVCFLQLPCLSKGQVYMACCGKVICSGCYFTLSEENPTGSAFLCVFCREPKPETEEDMGERYLDRVDVDDVNAICSVGCFHQVGKFGFTQSYTDALSCWQKAGELGSVESYCNIADTHDYGRGVERDQEKAWHYYELAAMGGNVSARYNLGATEMLVGNMDRALKHHMIATKSGCADSLKKIKLLHWNGHATANEYELALRSYHVYVDEIKSEQRDRAAAFSDEYTYYEYSKSEKDVILRLGKCMREAREAQAKRMREIREAQDRMLTNRERRGSVFPPMIVSSDGVPHTTIVTSDSYPYTSIGFEKEQPAGMTEAAAEATSSQQEGEEEVSTEGKEEDEGVESRDIEIVMSQTNCSRAKAVKALRAKDNNLVNAILSLSYGLKDDTEDI